MNEHHQPEDDAARAVMTILGEVATTANETPSRFTVRDIKTTRRHRPSSRGFRSSHYRRPAWAWLAVIATLAAVLVLGLRSLPSPKPGTGPASKPTPNASMMPPQMVILTSNFRIELISSRDGHVIRTLTDDVGLYRGTPQISISASGIVYFDEGLHVKGMPTEQILEVRLSGGRVTDLVEGHDPAVSPNGRLLAYLTYTDLSNVPEGIAVRNLVTGATRKWEYSTVAPDIGQLSWAPDSKSLSFTTVTPSSINTSLVLRAWTLNLTHASELLDGARQIPLPSGVAWAGYLSNSEGIGVSQHLGPTRESGSFDITQVDIRTGGTVRRYSPFPGSLGVDNTLDGAEGTLQLDQSRRDLSIIEVGAGHGSLYRWTIGSTSIVPIATGVITAAWTPASCSLSGACE